MADKKKPVVEAGYALGDTKPTANYIIFEPQTNKNEKAPVILGNNGKLYVRKDLVPEGAKEMALTIAVK